MQLQNKLFDMADRELYKCDYSKPSGTERLYKYDVPKPKMPPLSEMENYGLPLKEQKFRRTEIPKSIQGRKKILSKEEFDFIKKEHHKRHNGVWMIIKGIPIYFTGPYYTYLNYWWTIKGIQPEFRYIQCLIFLFWDMVVRDINSYGCFLVKPRRIGGTEFTLFLMWEYITRVRNTKGGMQSKDEKTILVNFKRLTRGNKRVVWFMKPIQKGSDDPEEKLEYRYPTNLNTAKGLREMAESGEEKELVYSEAEMNCEIDFKACDPLAYDNEELNRGILNEAGKLIGMSLAEWWDKTKPCYHYFDGAEIVGKCLAESSIEEINDEQINEVLVMCRDSDPDLEKRDENGRTISGLYLLFINYLDAAMPDEFGFPMREQAKLFHDNKINALKKLKKFKDITKLLRKEPEKLEDAITPSGDQSAFSKDRLQDALKHLDFPEEYGLKPKEHGIRGNFMWSGGQADGWVVFLADEGGKFFVTDLLKDGASNAYITQGGIKFPANVDKYRGGVDPFDFDLKEVIDKDRASLGGGVIMRMYDDNIDGAKKDDEGNPIDFGWEWQTKQPVCTYLFREEDSKAFFEDMLMMHVYYGTQMNVENNKKVIKNHFKDRGYTEYIMPRPESTMNESARDANTHVLGTPASTDTIDQYFHAITTYVMNYGNAIKHRDLIVQLLQMNKNNRGKLDLGVAFGFALMACDKKYPRMPHEAVHDETQRWFEYDELLQ